MMDELRVVCAWCVKEGVIQKGASGELVSHTICHRHFKQIVLEQKGKPITPCVSN